MQADETYKKGYLAKKSSHSYYHNCCLQSFLTQNAQVNSGLKNMIQYTPG